MNEARANAKPGETYALGGYAVRRTDAAGAAGQISLAGMPPRRRLFGSLRQAVTRQPKSRPQPAKKPEVDKLKAVVEESHELLLKVRSVFPMVLFPDTITIDRHKLTIIYRTFFGAGQTVSVPLKDIKNVQADLGPLFGSVTVTSEHFINNTQTVRYLWRRDVERIQRLVQGAMVAQEKEIDITKVSCRQLLTLLMDLGEGHSSVAAVGS